MLEAKPLTQIASNSLLLRMLKDRHQPNKVVVNPEINYDADMEMSEDENSLPREPSPLKKVHQLKNQQDVDMAPIFPITHNEIFPEKKEQTEKFHKDFAVLLSHEKNSALECATPPPEKQCIDLVSDSVSNVSMGHPSEEWISSAQSESYNRSLDCSRISQFSENEEKNILDDLEVIFKQMWNSKL